MAYPLISIYLTGAEIRKALEIVASVHPLKGSDYFLQVSGVRFTYNPRRVLFDRVSRVELGSAEQGWTRLDTSKGNTTLYRVVANYYNSAFLKLIGGFTFHILDIVPKDREAHPGHGRRSGGREPCAARIRSERWWLLERHFPDADGDPEIPRATGPEGDLPCLSPTRGAVVRGRDRAAIGAVVLVLAAAGLVLLIVWLVRRLIRRRPPSPRHA
jgi:5'-nucleotidase